jgi:hypothetical protein
MRPESRKNDIKRLGAQCERSVIVQRKPVCEKKSPKPRADLLCRHKKAGSEEVGLPFFWIFLPPRRIGWPVTVKQGPVRMKD